MLRQASNVLQHRLMRILELVKKEQSSGSNSSNNESPRTSNHDESKAYDDSLVEGDGFE